MFLSAEWSTLCLSSHLNVEPVNSFLNHMIIANGGNIPPTEFAHKMKTHLILIQYWNFSKIYLKICPVHANYLIFHAFSARASSYIFTKPNQNMSVRTDRSMTNWISMSKMHLNESSVSKRTLRTDRNLVNKSKNWQEFGKQDWELTGIW